MVEIKHILYATDHSKNALEAYQYAKSIADRYHARLTLLHVLQESVDLSIFDISMGRSTSERMWLEARREYLHKKQKETAEGIEAQYGSEGITADQIIVENGIAYKMILLVAEQNNCDFIVMGMKGRGRTLEETIMGDTVRRVLHQSRLPVLVVEPFEEKNIKQSDDV